MSITLHPPQLLEIAGPDAVAFAQAQFSSDVLRLENGHWHWSAWLSAQGRVRAFFHLLRDNDERLRLILRGASAALMRDALARYVFRTNVQLRTIVDMRAFLLEEETENFGSSPLPAATNIVADMQGTRIALPGRNPRWLWLSDAHTAPVGAEDSTPARNRGALADIEAGLVTLDTTLEDRLLPDWIGLGDLRATSVNKGCYPGQEIVARLYYKGGNKRWLHRIAFDADALPAPGSFLGRQGEGGNQEPGIIVCSAWVSRGSGVALAALGEGSSGHAPALHSPVLDIRNVERVIAQCI